MPYIAKPCGSALLEDRVQGDKRVSGRSHLAGHSPYAHVCRACHKLVVLQEQVQPLAGMLADWEALACCAQAWQSPECCSA